MSSEQHGRGDDEQLMKFDKSGINVMGHPIILGVVGGGEGSKILGVQSLGLRTSSVNEYFEVVIVS